MPVYIVRAYFAIMTEGDFKVVQTYKSKWVLDNPTLQGNYASRRVQMLSMKLPYKLYPLTKRITTISQLVACKAKLIIDAEGKLINWVKSTFYKIEICKVLSVSRTSTGKYLCYIQGYDASLLLDTYSQYVSVINVEGSPVLFDTHETRPDKSRIRIKL